jgi:hypothetical protein
MVKPFDYFLVAEVPFSYKDEVVSHLLYPEQQDLSTEGCTAVPHSSGDVLAGRTQRSQVDR